MICFKREILIMFSVFLLAIMFCGATVAVNNQNLSADTIKNQSLNYSNNNSVTAVKQQSAKAESANTVSIKGYWINNGADELNYINITALKKSGITDIFVLTSKQDPEGTLKPYINAFSGSGIKVHAWIICFKDTNGNWIDPQGNPTAINELINNITSIATKYNLDGIHLDSVRYPGTAYKYPNATKTVTSFVQKIYSNIKKINSQNIQGKHQILLSAALMPELGSNSYYYGQDYGQLAQYLDFLVPMIYKGNYNQNTAWIGTVTKYIVQHAGGKPVVSGIQTYRSDSNPTPIPASELKADINAAQSNGSSGYVLFKYGLVDKNFMTGIPSYKTATLAQIITAASTVKTYIEKYHKLPSYVNIGGSQKTMPTFFNLLLGSLIKINHGDLTSVAIGYFRAAIYPSESLKSGNIAKKEYLNMAQDIQNYMIVNGLAPKYEDTTLGKIRYESLIYMYSRILNYYGINKVLPNYVSVKSWF